MTDRLEKLETEAARFADGAEAHSVGVEAALAEYRSRQMLEHLMGPVISVLLHLGVLAACFVFLSTSSRPPAKPPEFTSIFLPVTPVLDENKTPPPEVEIQAMVNTDTTRDPLAKTEAGPSAENPGQPDVNTEFNDPPPEAPDTVAESSRILTVPRPKNIGPRPSLTPPGPGTKIRGPVGPSSNPLPSDRALLAGLRWLKANQNEDGSWSKSYPVAMTGLAALAYLGHGDLAESPEFGQTMNRALQYLAGRMESLPAGGVLERDYSHGIATYALAEAYSITKSPFLKSAMEKGIGSILKGQKAGGGWDYGFSQKGDRWDLSLSGWQIQALKAGFLAEAENPGLVDGIHNALAFLQKTAWSDGAFRYSSEEKAALRPYLQGVGPVCLQMLGQADSVMAKKGVLWIQNNLKPEWNDGGRQVSDLVTHFDPYGWYYQTQGLFHSGTPAAKAWVEKALREVVRGQGGDGHWEAPPPGVGGTRNMTGYGDIEPYYATALCCLTLEVRFRYLPGFRLEMDGKDSALRQSSGLDVE